MPELTVVEVEVERSRIEVNREVGIRVLTHRRDLIVWCSLVPPLSLLHPFRPLDLLSVCAPFSSFALSSSFAGCCSECSSFARACLRCSGARAIALDRGMIFLND
jgi:hypothetical protein